MNVLSPSPHASILNDLQPMHWAIAGAAIGLITLCLLFVANRRLGISTGFDDLCSFVLRRPYFRRRAVVSGRTWRLPFLAGLVLGGALSAALGGGWAPRWDAGMLDTVFALGEGAKLMWMFAGGLLIGFGTRLAGGCTSGHGIFGLSNAEGSGLATTLAFMAGGVLTTQLLYRGLAG
ncbi:MAG TPA: YeeE/YedE thiosulfate transporter family protein [Steroidobacteraceae bacterium]